MSAERIDPEDQWPLPPSWMWDCAECVRRYEAMKHVQAVVAGLTAEDPGVDWDVTDSIVGTQISLARHLADEHRRSLPDWEPGCETCAYHRASLAKGERRPEPRTGEAEPGTEEPESRTGAVMAAEEHRARHLFAPPRVVGLM
ncbi:hypothetical protein ACIO93_29480 [Streptomyces sp. NPDC087903]|uniref:hypothetical protein n=1 Tax=Streptomyces sp. NPDC087903 TaxID=3365819 RepID=UPI0037FA39DD